MSDFAKQETRRLLWELKKQGDPLSLAIVDRFDALIQSNLDLANMIPPGSGESSSRDRKLIYDEIMAACKYAAMNVGPDDPAEDFAFVVYEYAEQFKPKW